MAVPSIGQRGMLLTILQAIILGLVQGLGEFLPISSSAHLVLVPWLLGWPASGLAFDIALHLGTLAAVTLYFWKDLLMLAKEGLRNGVSTPTGRLGWGIALGTLPGALFGYLLKDHAETVRNPILIALLLALMGAVLYWVDRQRKGQKHLAQVTISDLLLIGCAQALAVIPGVSRSGATITAGLLAGLNRETSARVSFLLGWPIILGAGLLALLEMNPASLTPAFFVGVATSAISGYAVIAFLMEYLRRGTLLVFAVYRVSLAALVILLAAYRG